MLRRAVVFLALFSLVTSALAVDPAKLKRARERLKARQKKTSGAVTSDTLLRDIDRRAQRSRSAKEALGVYEAVLAGETLSAEQRTLADVQRKAWKEKAAKNLVRSGIEWVTAEESESRRKEADFLLKRAFTLVGVGDFKGARGVIEKASAVDPDGIRPDYILGMLNAPLFFNHAPSAEDHLRKALTRSPQNIAILNNLALTEIRLGKESQALAHWKRLLEIAPAAPNVTHNIGKVLDEESLGKISLTSAVRSKYRSLYSETVASGKGESYRTGGWRYLPLFLPKTESQRTTFDKGGALTLAGSGTGFVVHDQYILTCKHVIEDADGVRILLEGADPKNELEATVVGASQESDIALLHCPKLKAPAVPFNAAPQRRGTDLMVIGYPSSGVLGRTLKSTRGAVTGLPAPQYDNMLLHDAATNPGNSGGPVCDKQGNVIAVLAALYKLHGQIAAAVPVDQAVPLIRKHVNGFEPQPQKKSMEWPDIDAQISKSTVYVAVYQRPHSFGLRGQKQAARAYLVDSSCSACSGTGRVRCRVKGCVKGKVSVKKRVAVAINQQTRKPIYGTKTFKQPCGTCNGSGLVRCRFGP